MPSAADLQHLANRALAATATAFLSGAGGTRYGAAVLTAGGRVFESGQYSSFNHQTGVHAEQAALVAAVAAGCPDVVALAVASTKAPDYTRPCGTCRQIILEHGARCGRSIDVVMVGPGGSHDVRPIEDLLPDFWLPASAAGGRDAATRIRRGEPLPTQRVSTPRAGDHVLVDDRLIALVWDPRFMPGLALVKPKYLRQADGWAKVPHSFTESALHDAFREQHRLDRTIAPGVSLPVIAADREWHGWPAVPVAQVSGHAGGPELPDALCELLGVDPAAALVSGSLATGLHAGRDSDVDLVVRDAGPAVRQLRQEIARRILSGSLAVEPTSRSLELVTSIFGGAPGRLLIEGRYAESLRVAGRPVSIMYDIAGTDDPAVLPSDDAWQRGCFHGVVTEASRAAGKRSTWILDCTDGPLHVVCYHRGGNIVREGDRVSLTGWITGDRRGRSLLQTALHRDTIAWFHSD